MTTQRSPPRRGRGKAEVCRRSEWLAFDGTQFLPGGATCSGWRWIVIKALASRVDLDRVTWPAFIRSIAVLAATNPFDRADPEEHSAPWNQQGLGNSRLHQMSVGISG